MRKVISLLLVVALCVVLAVPVFADSGDFVPSITYKAEPEIVPIQDDQGEEVSGVIMDDEGETIDYIEQICLDVTPIAHVWDEDEVVDETVKALLAFVYEGITTQEIEIPFEKFWPELDTSSIVVRDLFDVRWCCDDHPGMVAPDGIVFDITFDLGVMPDADVYALTYDEETKEWAAIVNAVNNGDGTVTCTFEHLCAVVFATPVTAEDVPVSDVPVSDTPSMNVMPWIVVIVLAVAAAVAIIVKNKKKTAA